jgi:hypothetical protein
MPRYYFHLTNGKQVLSNHKGIDLSGNAAAREDALALARDLEHEVVMAGWNWTGWFVAIVDQLFYKKSVSRIFGRFPSPARSVAFVSARSHCSGSASFRVFNAVSDTPNSRCFRHRNQTPSKVPGSISSASALQIGHIVIATPCGDCSQCT